MAKLITFSRVFPKTHKRAGEPTGFSDALKLRKKNQTIRSGSRWRVGDMFSPREWSEKPYASKQNTLMPDQELVAVHNIEITLCGTINIDGVFYGTLESEKAEYLANKDGLSLDDFQDWFKKLPFKGQIICWYEKPMYL